MKTMTICYVTSAKQIFLLIALFQTRKLSQQKDAATRYYALNVGWKK